jgi:hypothetical protein
MLAAGGGYILGQRFEPRRNLSMTILQAFGARESLGPLCRAHTRVHIHVLAFVWGRLTAFNSDDLRWAIIGVALRLIGAIWAFAERQLSRWARSVLRRAWQGARFAAERRAADSMVAAGGR